MTSLWSGIGKYAAIALGVILALGLLWYSGYQTAEGKWKLKHQSYVDREAFAKEFQEQAWARDRERLKQGQEDIRKELGDQLAEAKAKQQPVRTIIKEVTKYVTEKADASCPITAGFQWVYNSTLRLPTAGDLAGSRPRDVDAATGITLSGVAQVAGENNAECVIRGEVIKAWQTWYLRNKQEFDRLGIVAPGS